MLKALTSSASVIMFNNCRRFPMLWAPRVPEGVVEVVVDAFGVVASRVEGFDAGIGRPHFDCVPHGLGQIAKQAGTSTPDRAGAALSSRHRSYGLCQDLPTDLPLWRTVALSSRSRGRGEVGYS